MTDSVDDIRKKYRNTFCFLELNGKKHLAEYTEDNGDNNFYFRSPDFGEIIVDKETVDTCLTHKFPENGLYNVQGTAVDFVRYPERQWKRAPYHDNCRITSILASIGVSLPLRFIVNLHNLEEIYQEKYPSDLEEALFSLKYSVAINKNFAVSHSTMDNRNEYLLWFKNQPVGVVKHQEKEIEVQYTPLFQEVQDFIRTQEPTWQLTKSQP